jgi:hypothetical protein
MLGAKRSPNRGDEEMIFFDAGGLCEIVEDRSA